MHQDGTLPPRPEGTYLATWHDMQHRKSLSGNEHTHAKPGGWLNFDNVGIVTLVETGEQTPAKRMPKEEEPAAGDTASGLPSYWKDLFRSRVWWTTGCCTIIAGLLFAGLLLLLQVPESAAWIAWAPAVIVGLIVLRIQCAVPIGAVAMTRCPTCDRLIGAGKKTCRLGHPQDPDQIIGGS